MDEGDGPASEGNNAELCVFRLTSISKSLVVWSVFYLCTNGIVERRGLSPQQGAHTPIFFHRTAH